MKKHSLGQPHWNAHQVFAWVYTRNPRLVVLLSDHDKGDSFDPNPIDFLAMSNRPGAEFADYAEAQEAIISTLQEDRLRSLGRREGVGTFEDVPTVEWIDLHFVWSVFHGFVEAVGMTDDPPASIVGAPRWYGLRFKRDDVLELWPPTETEIETGAEDPPAQTQRERNEPGPQTIAEIDVTQGDTREAEHDAPRSDVTPPLVPVNAETTDIEAVYAQRVNDHRVKTGRRPTFKADTEWRKSKGLKRDTLRDLRQKNCTDEEKKGGHPPRS